MPKISHRYPKLAVAFSILCVGFISIQFVRPELRTSPTRDINAHEPIKQILRNSCYDCHSNETRLEWFDHIAPMSWLVARHVKEGRRAFNFADFDRLPAAEQKAVLFEAIYKIQSGEMPPRSYTILHPRARVTPEQLAILKEYLGAQGRPHKQHSTSQHDSPRS